MLGITLTLRQDFSYETLRQDAGRRLAMMTKFTDQEHQSTLGSVTGEGVPTHMTNT